MFRRRTAVIAIALLLIATACTTNGDDSEIAALTAQVDELHIEIEAREDRLEEQAIEIEAFRTRVEEMERSLNDLRLLRLENERLIEDLRRTTAGAARVEASERRSRELACSLVDGDLPSSTREAFISWLEDERRTDAPFPDDLEISYVETVGIDDTWLLHARFSTMFEPGIFIARPDGTFDTAFAGQAESPEAILAVAAEQLPDDDVRGLICIDLTPFVG